MVDSDVRMFNKISIVEKNVTNLQSFERGLSVCFIIT